jgi:putative phosphoesterase
MAQLVGLGYPRAAVKLAVLSDVHDHVWNLRAALSSLDDAEAVLFCGDFCSPFVVALLAEGFPGRPVHAVFGNNDGDLYRIAQNAARHEHVHLYGEVFKGDLGGLRVAVNHFPDLALELARSGSFDLVCFGHDHRFRVEQEAALAVNPGTLLGWDPGARADVPATFAVVDADALEPVFFEVADGRVRALPD